MSFGAERMRLDVSIIQLWNTKGEESIFLPWFFPFPNIIAKMRMGNLVLMLPSRDTRKWLFKNKQWSSICTNETMALMQLFLFCFVSLYVLEFIYKHIFFLKTPFSMPSFSFFELRSIYLRFSFFSPFGFSDHGLGFLLHKYK